MKKIAILIPIFLVIILTCCQSNNQKKEDKDVSENNSSEEEMVVNSGDGKKISQEEASSLKEVNSLEQNLAVEKDEKASKTEAKEEKDNSKQGDNDKEVVINEKGSELNQHSKTDEKKTNSDKKSLVSSEDNKGSHEELDKNKKLTAEEALKLIAAGKQVKCIDKESNNKVKALVFLKGEKQRMEAEFDSNGEPTVVLTFDGSWAYFKAKGKSIPSFKVSKNCIEEIVEKIGPEDKEAAIAWIDFKNTNHFSDEFEGEEDSCFLDDSEVNFGRPDNLILINGCAMLKHEIAKGE